jgi:hypothetical protein
MWKYTFHKTKARIGRIYNAVITTQENCKVLVPTLRVGTHRIGRSASIEVEPTLLQHVTSPMDAERPTMRYDAERRNEGKIATLQFSRIPTRGTLRSSGV